MRLICVRWIVLITAVCIAGCGPTCENQIIATHASPSGALNAVVFQRGCGASTAFTTQLALIQKSAPLPDAPGNVLVADGTLELKIQWSGEQQLRVAGVGGAKTFKRENTVLGVDINYD